MNNRNHKILIVDDEAVIRDLISENLIELGYSCETAENGDIALEKMDRDKYDLVLLDIRLPGISGIEILKTIKSRYEAAVIMITAMDDVNTAVLSMKLGSLDYLVKPFNLETLNTSIESALQQKTALKVNQVKDSRPQKTKKKK